MFMNMGNQFLSCVPIELPIQDRQVKPVAGQQLTSL